MTPQAVAQTPPAARRSSLSGLPFVFGICFLFGFWLLGATFFESAVYVSYAYGSGLGDRLSDATFVGSHLVIFWFLLQVAA